MVIYQWQDRDVHKISCMRYKVDVIVTDDLFVVDTFPTYVVGTWVHALTDVPQRS